MQVSIQDRDALRAISPSALSAYARNAGWSTNGLYREHSDIYIGDALPEIIVPRTSHLGDYANVVAALVETFAQVADQDALTVYRSLATADRDVVRIRAAASDDGSLGLDDGVKLVKSARDIVLSAACSLHRPRAVYRAGANREATKLVEQMRLGQTDQGSFAVTLLTPVLPPPMPALFEESDDRDAPFARRMTRRLIEALVTVRRALEQAVSGDASAFGATVSNGVSANLCEALVGLIEPFPTLDIGVSWARTRPAKTPTIVRFGQADAALLRGAARSFREKAPEPDVRVHGFVRILERGEDDADGTIRLITDIDGQRRSVMAVLDQSDYERAVQAHSDKASVSMKGDLERVGQRWKLLNPRIESVLCNDEQETRDG